MTDELKPVRCGCGGEAVAIGDADNDIYFAKCDKCWISTDLFHSEAEAVTAWNRAMGERIAKVTLLTPDTKGYWSTNGRCQGCGFLLERAYAYCPNCGARLEWK